MQKAKFWLPLSRYFTATGRISRLQYFVHSLVLFVVFEVLSLLANSEGAALDAARGHLIAAVATTLLMAFAHFCLDAKRLHDLGWPAAIAAIMLAEPAISAAMTLAFSYAEYHPQGVIAAMRVISPLWRIVFAIVGLMLLFVPGNKGQNKYGPDPLKPPAPPVEVF